MAGHTDPDLPYDIVIVGRDCTAKRLRQVVTACGDGATAAFSAQLYVEGLKGESY